MTGTFITLEGIDGSGKSTVLEMLYEHYGCSLTSEPSTNYTGRYVRDALQEDTPPFMDFFLFMADRHYHIENDIKPILEEGEMIISDRFTHSTLAYQPVQLSEWLDDPKWFMQQVMEPWNIRPHLTIFLDISVETSLERCGQDEKYENREMLEKVYSNYKELLLNDHRMIRVDAEKPLNDVFDDCVTLIEEIR